MMFIYQCTAL